MASGSFPLHPVHDANGLKLKAAADLVADVCRDVSDEVYAGESGGMQFDNAASDGGSLALLYLAEKLIRDELSKPREREPPDERH